MKTYLFPGWVCDRHRRVTGYDEAVNTLGHTSARGHNDEQPQRPLMVVLAAHTGSPPPAQFIG